MPNPIVEQAQAEALELARRLKAQIREDRARAEEVSEALGYARKYLGRVFAGRIDLKLLDVFGVLRELNVSPRTFFSRHYPLAGATALPKVEAAGILAQVKALLQRAEGPPWVPEPAVLNDRASRLLRGLLVRAGKTQRAVAEELGSDRHALGQVLRGRLNLRAWHAFALMAATGASPALFFHELLAMAEEDRPLPGVEAGEITELLERTLRAFAQPATPPVKSAPKPPAAKRPARGRTAPPRSPTRPKIRRRKRRKQKA